ncbi:MAG: thermonuclease family protein [Bdellovibrio sp.]|nr:thermonuclease family protein [Bdellovibrio sp.]
MKFASLFLSLTLALSPSAFAKKKKHKITNLSGYTQSCHDGDTCRVLVGKKSLKIRFAGIDCPELSQKHGKEARDFTKSLVVGKEVNLVCEGSSYDRLTCTVFQNGKNINQAIVEHGWAYDSTKYSKGRYLASVNEAKSQRKGIWNDPNLISPYCYRHKTNKNCSTDLSYMP